MRASLVRWVFAAAEVARIAVTEKPGQTENDDSRSTRRLYLVPGSRRTYAIAAHNNTGWRCASKLLVPKSSSHPRPGRCRNPDTSWSRRLASTRGGAFPCLLSRDRLPIERLGGDRCDGGSSS